MVFIICEGNFKVGLAFDDKVHKKYIQNKLYVYVIVFFDPENITNQRQ